MTYTSHGHQIPGTMDSLYPPAQAACGGIQGCKSCLSDAAQHMQEGTQMMPQDFPAKAKELLINYVDSHYSQSFDKPEFEVYVVWFVKVLQHWKALVSTDMPDGKYYELTYNGDKRETYIDEYVKVKNTVVPDKEKAEEKTPTHGIMLAGEWVGEANETENGFEIVFIGQGVPMTDVRFVKYADLAERRQSCSCGKFQGCDKCQKYQLHDPSEEVLLIGPRILSPEEYEEKYGKSRLGEGH
ncbi:hypothetical protein SEA_ROSAASANTEWAA_42 [Streptomyces phage RosaAsantewaa]|nr:hypothetical protein SEA_ROSAASANTEWAA_42 [Streptomyces phage RosaAsantewaa]